MCSVRRSSSSISTGVHALERLEELHLRARPGRLVAAVLVGQQVDVVGVGVGRLVEAVQPFVDVADGGVDLAVARRGGRGRQRLVERLRAACCAWPANGPGRSARATTRGDCVSARVVGAVGLVEQAARPERVAAAASAPRRRCRAWRPASRPPAAPAPNSATRSAVRTLPLRALHAPAPRSSVCVARSKACSASWYRVLLEQQVARAGTAVPHRRDDARSSATSASEHDDDGGNDDSRIPVTGHGHHRDSLHPAVTLNSGRVTATSGSTARSPE